MRFSRRIFLAVSATGAVGVLAGSLAVYAVARDVFTRDYESDYRARLSQLARDFTAQESVYHRLALNAAYVVRDLDEKKKGRWTDAELAALAKTLGVDNIKLSDAKGAFVASGDGNRTGNLFAFCPGYRALLDGGAELQQTPLIPDARNPGTAGRFTMIPTRDHKRVIDVSLHFGELAGMLRRVVDDSDNDISRISLRAPGGALLGEISQASAAGASAIAVSVPADDADCCECRARGLVAPGQPYAYEFSALASRGSLNRMMTTLEVSLLAVTAILLLVALAAASWLSGALLNGLLKIRAAVDAIAASRDFSHAIPEGDDPRDELTALAAHFNRMFASMRDAQAELVEAKKAEARAAVAAQVAHDIRSPLTSMTLALNRLQSALPPGSPEQSATAEMISILSHGISRVSGILKRLARSGKAQEAGVEVETPRLTLVDKLFFEVAQEAAMKLPSGQRLSVEGFPTVPASWAVVQVAELQSALSNLLNNASEAVGENGRIRLVAVVEPNQLGLLVRDNGKGIPPELIERVFEREFTSGKEGGSGLGLFQAKKAVEWCGGKIRIESRVGEGTSVILAIPTERAPKWCVDEVPLAPGQTLVVADDDPGILAVWRDKAGGLPFRAFSSIAELEQALPSLGAREKLVFVLDQHAGEGLSGTAFLEKYGPFASAYLSTSEYDDPGIQDKIKTLNARMIPKPRLAAARVTETKA